MINLRNDHIEVIRRGDIFWHIFEGYLMPVLVIQNDIGNEYSDCTIIAKMSASETIRLKHVKIPTIVKIFSEDIEIGKKKGSSLKDIGFVLTSEIYTIPKKDLKQYIGHLNEESFESINKALKLSLGL